MDLRESVAKAQLQLLGIQSTIEAEGWDKDPDWVTRGKDGKFGAKDSSDGEGSNKNLQNLKIEDLQASYELLTKQAKEVYANTINSESSKKVHNKISTAIAKFFDTNTGKIYKQAVEECKKVEPKKYIDVVNQKIKQHPLEAEIGAVILGTLTGLCLAGTAIFASEALVAAAAFSINAAAKQETKLSAIAAGQAVRNKVDNTIKAGVAGVLVNKSRQKLEDKATEGFKRREQTNKIVDELKLKSVLEKKQAEKFAELIYDAYADPSERINNELQLLDKLLKK
jgi:hypothetical protein